MHGLASMPFLCLLGTKPSNNIWLVDSNNDAICKLDVIGSIWFTVTSAHTQTVARQLASSALQEADASSVLNRRRGCHL